MVKEKKISLILGFWSALFITVLGVGYSILMGLYFVFLKYPIPAWVNLDSYIQFTHTVPYWFFTIGQIVAFSSGLLLVVLISSLHDYAPLEKKSVAHISLSFCTIGVVLASITYFIQFTVVPGCILSGNTNGLEQFIQLNTKSIAAAIVILGWGLFIGLGSLFIAPIFSNKGIEKYIKWSFVIAGIFLIVNNIGFMFQSMVISIIATSFYNLGLTVACILICVHFKGLRK